MSENLNKTGIRSVSIVIPTKNRYLDLLNLLESLKRQSYRPQEVVIVDASSDDIVQNIASLYRNDFKIIYLKQEYGGLATARNIGNSYANGDIVFQLEDDIVLDKDYIKEIIKVFDKDKTGKIAGVGGVCLGRSLKKHNIMNEISQIIYNIISIIILRDTLKKGKVTIAGHHSQYPNKSSKVKWLFNGAYRRDIIKTYNYDINLEKYLSFAYYDDFEFSYKISKDYDLFVTDKAGFYHNTSLVEHSHIGIKKAYKVKIINHYYIIKKYNISRSAFWLSNIAIAFIYIICFVMRPNMFNYYRALGTMSGLLEVIKMSN